MTIVFFTSSQALSQDIETLVMPGEVIEGHAEIETDCSSCHVMFNKAGQRQLCMDCHEDVAADIATSLGYHGLHPEASGDQCASCHTDHEGRGADVVIFEEDDFDHDYADFAISDAHLEAECGDCHVADKKYREAPSECVDCHRDEKPHEESMDDDCASCHKPTDWADGEFDHDSTEYPLLGKHREAACLDCHDDHTFPEPPTTCFGCHEDDDAHDGRSGNECGACHNPSDWNDSSFNHERDTEFPLEGAHSDASCSDCHSEDPFDDEMDKACVSCHLEDDEHDKHRGDQCDTCHASTTWEEPFFDHGVDTDYTLLGGHREVACNECHIEPIFEVELLTNCDSCHADDDPHESVLGAQCETCHTEVNWQDPVFFDHDLTRFPLHGAHNEQECDSCHTNQAYANESVDCISCHRDDDSHKGNFADQCGSCHNPVSWDLWTFDHDLQTDFPLDGAHVDVGCNDCHRMPLDKIRSIEGSCRDCHRADDIHDGEFGADCGRCHSADSFTEVRSLQ